MSLHSCDPRSGSVLSRRSLGSFYARSPGSPGWAARVLGGSKPRGGRVSVVGPVHEMNRHRILLADDHALVRAGLRALLDGLPNVEVVGEAEHGAEALKLAAQLHPDVVVLELSMPILNGIEA